MQKTKERYSKEKAAEYSKIKEAIKENSKNRYKKNNKIKGYQRQRYQQLIQYKKEALHNIHNKWVLFLLSIRMSKKTLKLDNIKAK